MSQRQRSCDRCGRTYAYARSTSRYCGSACRALGPAPSGNVVALRTPGQTPPAPTRETSTYDQAHAELAAAGRLDTLLGSALLRLATRIDANATDTGSALASMVKQLQATREAALDGAAGAADPVDELRRIRDVKRRAAAG